MLQRLRRAWIASALLISSGCRLDAAAADGGSDTNDEPCNLSKQLWTIESQALVSTLLCADGRSVEATLSDADAPDGLTLERGELRWTPSLEQAGNYLIELALPRDERGELRIGVADRFEDEANAAVVDAVRYTHELGLPVFHLGAAAEINDDDYTPATLIYAGQDYFGVQAKYRGSTSRNYPKRSFTLKLDKNERFTDEARGFRSARRLVLTSTFDDNSQIRQRLAFELWNRLDPEHIAINHFNAVVYLNGQYQGVYAVTDHVNDDLLEQRGLPPAINMYKARLKEANFRLTDRNGAPKKQLRAGYTKEEGDPPDSYEDLEELLSWVTSASDADFRDQFSARLTPEFQHWFIMVTLSAAVDTTTKNYYLMHDARPEAPDTRWRFIPWDFNVSFGQGISTQRRGAEDGTLARLGRSNRLFERLLNDPVLRAPLMQRFREAMQGAWTADEMGLVLERYASEVEAAAERDELRWSEARHAYFSDRSDWTSPSEEIDYLRAWIAARWHTVAEQLDE